MYEYTLDLVKEQQEARRIAIDYIYIQLPENFDPSNVSIVRQGNGTTISVFYKGRHIGTVHEYYDGSTWNIEAKRVPLDKEDL